MKRPGEDTFLPGDLVRWYQYVGVDVIQSWALVLSWAEADLWKPRMVQLFCDGETHWARDSYVYPISNK